MKNLTQKLGHLNWLNSVGIEYYCSTQKESKNSLIATLAQKEHNINENELLSIKNQTTIDIDMPSAWKKPDPIISDEEKQARLLADSARSLDELRASIENFQGCELKSFASNTVFADGNPRSSIMLIGEAPGATEDIQGIPFCGESGKLLDNMLKAIGVSRAQNAYITNTVFWRPPANRRPTNEEINICRPFVEKHIALINPKLIIIVGNTAAISLLGKNEGITNIRKNIYPYMNQYLDTAINMTAIFHPAYLLRQPMQKKATWFDLLKIKEMI